jgi:hypothetical protein
MAQPAQEHARPDHVSRTSLVLDEGQEGPQTRDESPGTPLGWVREGQPPGDRIGQDHGGPRERPTTRSRGTSETDDEVDGHAERRPADDDAPRAGP